MARPALLVTRPQASAARFIDALDKALLDKADLCLSPLLEITATGKRPDVSGFDGVIFTSANGVCFAGAGGGKPAYCVGAHTGQTAAAKGWDVRLTCPTADALVAEVGQRKLAGRLLHLAGVHRRGEIAQRISSKTLHVDLCEVYDQTPVPLSAAALALLSGEAPVILPLFSPRTAAQFVAQAQDVQKLHVIAMSAAVAAELPQSVVHSLHVVPEPTLRHMRQAVELQLRSLCSA